MLFSKDQLRTGDEEEFPDQPDALHVAGDVRHVVGRKKVDLARTIGPLVPNEHIHVPSMGAWSMHHLMAYILQQTGPSDVWFTTWTIAEEAVRIMLEQFEVGNIRQLRALLSERTEAMNPKAHQMVRFNIDVRFTKIHAKSLVVMNEEHAVVVGGSANFTRNPRIEKYIISTHRQVAEREVEWIEKVRAKADPFA